MISSKLFPLSRKAFRVFHAPFLLLNDIHDVIVVYFVNPIIGITFFTVRQLAVSIASWPNQAELLLLIRRRQQLHHINLIRWIEQHVDVFNDGLFGQGLKHFHKALFKLHCPTVRFQVNKLSCNRFIHSGTSGSKLGFVKASGHRKSLVTTAFL